MYIPTHTTNELLTTQLQMFVESEIIYTYTTLRTYQAYAVEEHLSQGKLYAQLPETCTRKLASQLYVPRYVR